MNMETVETVILSQYFLIITGINDTVDKFNPLWDESHSSVVEAR